MTTVDSMTITTTQPKAVPVRVTYVLGAKTLNRLVGPYLSVDATVYFDHGSSMTVFAPGSAESGSILNSPPDNKTFRFTSWTLNGGTPIYTQIKTWSPGNNDELALAYQETTTHLGRSPTRRATKFQAKTDEEVAQIRTAALKTLQIKNQAIIAYEQTSLETKLGTVLCDLGIIGNDQHHYRNFAQEIYGLRKTFTSTTLTSEAIMRATKWFGRGLSWDTLTKTAALQGIDLGASP